MKDLVDLAKGIHLAEDEEQYIAQQMQDIAVECHSKNSKVKTEAIRKLTYLFLLGYDIKSYAFNTIECMSSEDFFVKKNGYFASYFSFGSPDMATLSTNLYANDLRNKSESIRSLALASLASCPTPNASEFHTLFPILLDQMNIIINGNQSANLLNKFMAAITRFLIESKNEGIDVESAPARFVEILYGLAQNNIISADAMSSEIFAHISLELAVAFGASIVMRVVPQTFDILITAKQPWVLLDVVKFFAVVASHDSRVCEKVGKHFLQLLQTTESRSLEMELSRAIARSFANDRQLVLISLTKMAEYVAPTENVYTDENLCILAVKNIAELQKCHRGICGEVPGLTAALIKLLDDVDFSIKTAVLEVINGMANEELLQSIVIKLLQTLKNTKLQNSGASISELHQISPVDVMFFKKRLVDVLVSICCENNYNNVSDFEWLLDVFVTLIMEHTELSAALIAPRLLDLSLRSAELRSVLPSVLNIIMKSQRLQAMMEISDDSGQLATLSLVGGVQSSRSLSLPREVELYSQLLSCTFNMSSEEAAEPIGTLLEQLWRVPDGGSQFEFLSREYYQYMLRQNLTIQTRTKSRNLLYATEERLLRSDELQTAAAISQLLQVCAWITGTCLQFEPLDSGVKVDELLDILTSGTVSKFSSDLKAVYLIAAVRAYASLVNSYENALSDAKTASCFTAEWFNDVFLVETKGEETAFNAHASLVKTFAFCYSLLHQRLPTFVSSIESQELITALFNILKASSAPLLKGVELLSDESLRDQIRVELQSAVLSEDEVLPEVNQFLTFNPEVNIAEVYEQPHPAFAFENGKIFSLDHDETNIFGDSDLFGYCPEEYSQQEKRHHKKRAQKSSIDVFVDKPVEESPASEVEARAREEAGEAIAEWGQTNEIGAALGQKEPIPVVKSAFIIDKSKLQRGNELQMNKYTSGIKVDKISIQKSPPANVQIGGARPASDAQEVEKKRRRHKKHEDGEKERADDSKPASQNEVLPTNPPVEETVVKPVEAVPAADEKPADDDLMSLLM